MKPITLILLVFAFVLCACAPSTGAPTSVDAAEQAAQALTGFFEAVQRGDYAAAEALFGDNYEILGAMNPGIPVSDHTGLWKQACRSNGFQCLKVKEIVSTQQVDENTFRFVVHFEQADGTLFIQGPCCGEDETSMPPISEFEYEVRRNAQGKFQMMDMPPYIP